MIEVSDENLKEAAKKLSGIKNGMEKALTRALNHSIAKSKTQIKRSVTKGYYIKSGEVQKTLAIKKASWTNPFATITSKSPVLGLGKFKVTQRAGVLRAAVSKVEGYKERKGAFTGSTRDFKGGETKNKKFIPNFSNVKSIRVFKRKGSSRLPIVAQHGASVPGIIGNENVIMALNNFALKETNARISHEVGRILGGYR